jgi:hypothetical protein
VHDGVRRASQCRVDLHCVLERLTGEDLRGAQSFPREIDGPTARLVRKGVAAGVDRGDGSSARGLQAQRFSDARHG